MYVRLSYGVYGEWGYYGMREEAPDYSPMLQHSKFLVEQYDDDKTLQAAWRDPTVTLDTAMIPTVAERAGEDDTCTIRLLNASSRFQSGHGFESGLICCLLGRN